MSWLYDFTVENRNLSAYTTVVKGIQLELLSSSRVDWQVTDRCYFVGSLVRQCSSKGYRWFTIFVSNTKTSLRRQRLKYFSNCFFGRKQGKRLSQNRSALNSLFVDAVVQSRRDLSTKRTLDCTLSLVSQFYLFSWIAFRVFDLFLVYLERKLIDQLRIEAEVLSCKRIGDEMPSSFLVSSRQYFPATLSLETLNLLTLVVILRFCTLLPSCCEENKPLTYPSWNCRRRSIARTSSRVSSLPFVCKNCSLNLFVNLQVSWKVVLKLKKFWHHYPKDVTCGKFDQIHSGTCVSFGWTCLDYLYDTDRHRKVSGDPRRLMVSWVFEFVSTHHRAMII